MLSDYSSSEYEVIFRVNNIDGSKPTTQQINEMKAAIDSHVMYRACERIWHTDYPIYLLRVADIRYNRGIIRTIKDTRNSIFPSHQMITVKKGAEIFYCLLKSEKALGELTRSLQMQHGSEMIDVTVIADVKDPSDVYEHIPNFFKEIIPEELNVKVLELLKTHPIDKDAEMTFIDDFKRIVTDSELVIVILRILNEIKKMFE